MAKGIDESILYIINTENIITNEVAKEFGRVQTIQKCLNGEIGRAAFAKTYKYEEGNLTDDFLIGEKDFAEKSIRELIHKMNLCKQALIKQVKTAIIFHARDFFVPSGRGADYSNIINKLLEREDVNKGLNELAGQVLKLAKKSWLDRRHGENLTNYSGSSCSCRVFENALNERAKLHCFDEFTHS